MEEKKDKEQVNEAINKLTYDQLKNVTSQLAQQFDKCRDENEKLKKYIENEIVPQRLYTEINLLFKVLKYSEYFSVEFVNNCVDKLEFIMKDKSNNISGENHTDGEDKQYSEDPDKDRE